MFFQNSGKSYRRRQDSNLWGNIPLDFESNALTTRPRRLPISNHKFLVLISSIQIQSCKKIALNDIITHF